MPWVPTAAPHSDGHVLSNFAAQFTRYACVGPSYDAWVAQNLTPQEVQGSLFGASILDGIRGTLLFYGPSQLKQVFVELMMLARRPRQHGAAWREFLYHSRARVMPSHCVLSLKRTALCALNASAWPLFAGKKTWDGNDYFIPPVIDLQVTPDLRVIGVFNAFRLQASPHGLSQLTELIAANDVTAVIFHPPHPNSYFADQCCTSNSSATSVCDGCSMYHRLQRSQIELLLARRRLPGLLTASWGVDDEGNVHGVRCGKKCERLTRTPLAATDFFPSPANATCNCPCCTAGVAEDGTKESAYGVPSSNQARAAQACGARLSIIPRPMYSHVCQPGPVRPLAVRTAAWVREKARTVPCKDGFECGGVDVPAYELAVGPIPTQVEP